MFYIDRTPRFDNRFDSQLTLPHASRTNARSPSPLRRRFASGSSLWLSVLVAVVALLLAWMMGGAAPEAAVEAVEAAEAAVGEAAAAAA